MLSSIKSLMSLLAVEGEICKNSETSLESVMGTWNS